MIRNLKAFGLALIAVFALSAVAASGAQAAPKFTGFETPTGLHVHTIIKGEQVGNHQFFPAGEGEGFGAVECEVAKFEGTSLTGEDESITIKPTYEKCHATVLGVKFNADVNMNGCHYVFFIGATQSETMNYTGHTNIVGDTEEKTGPIKVTVTNSEGGVKCEDTIAAQNNVGPIKYETMTEKPTDVTVTSEATNVVNETHQGALACGIAKGVHNNGRYVGNTTVRGFNTNGEQIDIDVSGS
jgi:hypothetical protein